MPGGATPPPARAVPPQTIPRACPLFLARSQGLPGHWLLPPLQLSQGEKPRNGREGTPASSSFVSSELPGGGTLTLSSSFTGPTLWKYKTVETHTAFGLPWLSGAAFCPISELLLKKGRSKKPTANSLVPRQAVVEGVEEGAHSGEPLAAQLGGGSGGTTSRGTPHQAEVFIHPCRETQILGNPTLPSKSGGRWQCPGLWSSCPRVPVTCPCSNVRTLYSTDSAPFRFSLELSVG